MEKSVKLKSQSGKQITITQGDTPTLALRVVNENGTGVDLTGAVLETSMRGAIGALVTIPAAQHTIDPDQAANPGKFTLALTDVDTLALEAAPDKDVVTKVDLAGVITYVHGVDILQVLVNTPSE